MGVMVTMTRASKPEMPMFHRGKSVLLVVIIAGEDR